MSKKSPALVPLSTTIVCFMLVAQVACRHVSEEPSPLNLDDEQLTNEAEDRQSRGMFANWRFFFNPYSNYSSNYGQYNSEYDRDPKRI